MPRELEAKVNMSNEVFFDGWILTPAMNNPKATPKCVKFATPTLVSAGIHRLPGASFFVNPSTMMTNTRRTVDTIPRIDVYDSRDKGRNTVGMSLDSNCEIEIQVQKGKILTIMCPII